MFAILLAVLGVTQVADNPVSFASAEIGAALSAKRSGTLATVFEKTKSGVPESYSILVSAKTAKVTAPDETGLMYGGLELAEQIRLGSIRPKTEGKPFLADRGLNVFLTLPWDYIKNNTDYHPSALVDPNRWWFANDGYWRMLFDSMARHRLNWLDIHGTWDVSVTDAPNLYAYFIQSDQYPEVGVPASIKARNLRQLNKVIDMAHARGVKVSLMAYEARLRTPHAPNPPYPNTEEVSYAYTREMVEKMIRQAPQLDAIAYRIGESGKGESFFKCYQEAVAASGRDIPLLTRTWLTRKSRVLPLALDSKDYRTQIKYNGEQWGPPYFIAGGRTAGWYSYSFEDYLSHSNAKGATKMWPGNKGWPPNPYREVWQVRLNGTHRIFPFFNPEWVRRTVETMNIGTASGFTVEPLNAYYPASPDYYLANAGDRWTDWILERDEPFLMLWGRYGYDPNTNPKAFELWFDAKFGSQGDRISRTWTLASKVVPTVFTLFSIGPDHRHHAPELELGGGLDEFIAGEPFDAFSVMSTKEAAMYRALNLQDGRRSNASYASELHQTAAAIRAEAAEISVDSPRTKELVNSLAMLAHLADYYAARLTAAWEGTALAQSPSGTPNAEQAAMEAALQAWKGLSLSTEAQFYKPFTERLKLRTNTYHWKTLLPELESIVASAKGSGKPYTPASTEPAEVPKGADLGWKVVGKELVVSIPARGLDRAWLLHKPLPSTTFFHRTPMDRKGDAFVARIQRLPCGHVLSADVDVDGRVRRLFDWKKETPYRMVPSQRAATPPYYSNEEALAYLDPKILTPDQYGALLLPTRSLRFFTFFRPSLQRKVLEPVKQGMRLIVLQQDYLSGRYPLKWLPVAPKVVAKNSDEFLTGGALGLPDVHAPGILWQAFEPTPGWEVFGNGGLARYKLGRGEVWLIQARVFQLAHYPEAARFLARAVSLGGGKPVVLLDHCGEGADSVSALFTDLMNALGVPFVTLGEAIAEKQGMDSNNVKPGYVNDDDVLEGRGPEIMKAFLAGKVKQAASRPLPTSREEMEADKPRRKAELMKALGLDPLPPRTPLNVRITGKFERNGYTIEKVVYESRPGFYVTGHLYLPKGQPEARFPVILNPHGHWGNKKMEPTVQHRLIAQALHGYAAFIIDSPGESWEGESPAERKFQGSHWDFPLIVGSANTTALYVWDMMRGLDYLETRPECDTSKVGITGASGGGLATVYNFAADERIKVAVPVVYATSLEVSPTNGCPCNHVPATLQIGDRSDVLAIRAPAPIYLIGATDDWEFPPAGTQITGEKLKGIYGLYGKEADTGWEVFPGPHDYNKAMRERAIGFFDLHLKGQGDGSPVPEPDHQTEDFSDLQFRALDSIPAGARTMRDIALENLSRTKDRGFEEVAKLNGGIPQRAELGYRVVADRDDSNAVAFQSEKGLTIPAVLLAPKGRAKGGVVILSELGKVDALKSQEAQSLIAAGFEVLAVDVRGIGELKGLDVRLMAYLGTCPAFAMATDLCAAVDALRQSHSKVAVVGVGSAGAQAAMFAALMDKGVSAVAGLNGMQSYAECLELPLAQYETDGFMLQPRADSGTSLEHLRSQVACPALWTYDKADPEGLVAFLERTFR